MLHRLHWMILRKLPGPFAGWLGVLMFLLIMQFLIRWLPDIAGRGLPLTVIIELIVYNLAYMVVLAVPMSVLLATIMAFGSLAESQAYTVIKGAGISVSQIVWPVLVVGVMVSGGMMYFNNVVLPEANWQARNLWQDIRSQQPGFELQPGQFYDGMEGLSILVQDRPPDSNELYDVTIYDYREDSRRQAIIKAERGYLDSQDGGLAVALILKDGEMHRTRAPRSGQFEDRYERLQFAEHTIRLDLSDFAFQRSESDEDGSRTTRTMPTAQMVELVDSLSAENTERYASFHKQIADIVRRDTTAETLQDRETAQEAMPSPPADADADTAAAPSRHVALDGLDADAQRATYSLAHSNARSLNSSITDVRRNVEWRERRIRQYRVEIHKKYSIAVACLLFTLVGIPLGLTIRRGSLGAVGAYSLGIFLLYWITLVQGEKLATRDVIAPWLGMWVANMIMIGLSLWLVVYIILDLRATPPLRRRLWLWIKSIFE